MIINAWAIQTEPGFWEECKTCSERFLNSILFVEWAEEVLEYDYVWLMLSLIATLMDEFDLKLTSGIEREKLDMS